jgi:hypothetical protein
VVTYENACIPQALIEAGSDMGDMELIDRGVQLAGWLFAAMMRPEADCLALPGNDGWWRRGSEMPVFDEQPVEIPSLIAAALAAHRVSRDEAWIERAEAAYDWLFGRNLLGVSLYEPATGGCYDGLMPHGVNHNQGAEALLSLLFSWQAMRAVRDRGADEEVIRLPRRNLRSVVSLTHS